MVLSELSLKQADDDDFETFIFMLVYLSAFATLAISPVNNYAAAKQAVKTVENLKMEKKEEIKRTICPICSGYVSLL